VAVGAVARAVARAAQVSNGLFKTWSVRVSSQVSFSRNFMVGGDAVIIHVPDASLVEWMPMYPTNAFGLSASAFHGDHHLQTYYVLALLFAGSALLILRLYCKDFMCLT
jgi:hypothetical protein